MLFTDQHVVELERLSAEQTQELLDQVCSLEKQLEQARLEV